MCECGGAQVVSEAGSFTSNSWGGGRMLPLRMFVGKFTYLS